MTHRTRMNPGLAIGVLALCAMGTLQAQTLLGPGDVLRRIESPAPVAAAGPASASAPGALLADIKRYRTEVAAMPGEAAAARWFELYDRVIEVDPSVLTADFAAYDAATGRVVGRQSLFASLPPPAAWPALRKMATQRAGRGAPEREAIAIRFLAELLNADRAAARASLDALDGVAAGLEPDRRTPARWAIADTRAKLVGTYGSPEDVARAFEMRIKNETAESYFGVVVPDLVGLVGADEARRLLALAVVSDVELNAPSGDATRKLAREIALENIARMRKEQWALAESIDSAKLYEAMEKRFDPAASQVESSERAARDIDSYRKQTAAAWYFLASVVEGRQADAERTLAFLAGDQDVYLPEGAVDSLRRAGQDEALYRFLAAQLERRPQLRAWDVYIREAAFLGHAADSLALVDKQLSRRDLPEFLVAEMRVRRLSALLAADRVDEAAQGYRALLQKVPVRGEPTLDTRLDAALNAALVGRLLQKRDLQDLGLRFVTAALPLRTRPNGDNSLDGRNLKLWRELRKRDRAAEVQTLAIDVLSRVGARSGFQLLGERTTAAELNAMVELSGIWSEAGRHADVLQLARTSTRWGLRDAGALLSVTDSLGTPFGVILARALHATGDDGAALRVARATASHLPGRDGAYELISELDPDALATFDSMFALDAYEERPLIWKATVQMRRNAPGDAEVTIRRAIAIDPSDGEEGPNDRMRAYAVLSALLEKKGDSAAETYANAVAAIRMSEHADQFHEAGLYERAFKEYREALEKFSDAYCIQSRLAVQLSKQGRRAEALEHYRRAYELMPDSFGRVESHCFGCESVFQGSEAQSLAERVFTDAIGKTPGKAQVYYLLAYLREQQERPADALAPLRKAVGIDPQYLNAWSHIEKAGQRTYVEPWELDLARLKLLELDPLQRHVTYSLAQVGDLAALWRGAERASTAAAVAKPIRDGVFELPANAAALAKARSGLPPEMLEQLAVFEEMGEVAEDSALAVSAAPTLAKHEFVKNTLLLMGVAERDDY